MRGHGGPGGGAATPAVGLPSVSRWPASAPSSPATAAAFLWPAAPPSPPTTATGRRVRWRAQGTPREVAYSPAHPAVTDGVQRRWVLIGGRSRRCTQPPGGATPVLLFRRRCFVDKPVCTFAGDSLMSGSSSSALMTDVGGGGQRFYLLWWQDPVR